MNDEKAHGGPTNAAPGTSQTGAIRSIPLHNNSIDSRELFRNSREITISHGDETYRLRLTAQNKLILTK